MADGGSFQPMAAPAQTDVLMTLQRALPRVGGAGAWTIAAGVIVLTGGLKMLFDALAHEPLPPFITFYPAVVVAALVGGLRIGLAAAATTLLTAWYFWIPNFLSFAMSGPSTPLTLATYAVTSTMLALIIGVSRTALDRIAESGAERDLAARESVHRIKNLIAVVQALANKIERETDTKEQFKEVLTQRLRALHIAQDVLVRQDWQDVQLKDIIDGALAPFLPNPGLHLAPGPNVYVDQRHVSGLSLALYELATNAMKYGALSDGAGPVCLSWRCEGGACTLEWNEARRAQQPIEEAGFGTTLIKMALSRDHDTRVDYQFTSTHVIAVFVWPTPAMRA